MSQLCEGSQCLQARGREGEGKNERAMVVCDLKYMIVYKYMLWALCESG